jgi:hypothetical protein
VGEGVHFSNHWKPDETSTERVPFVSSHPVRLAATPRVRAGELAAPSAVEVLMQTT